MAICTLCDPFYKLKFYTSTCWRGNAFRIDVNIVINYLHLRVCREVQPGNEIGRSKEGDQTCIKGASCMLKNPHGKYRNINFLIHNSCSTMCYEVNIDTEAYTPNNTGIEIIHFFSGKLYYSLLYQRKSNQTESD